MIGELINIGIYYMWIEFYTFRLIIYVSLKIIFLSIFFNYLVPEIKNIIDVNKLSNL